MGYTLEDAKQLALLMKSKHTPPNELHFYKTVYGVDKMTNEAIGKVLQLETEHILRRNEGYALKEIKPVSREHKNADVKITIAKIK